MSSTSDDFIGAMQLQKLRSEFSRMSEENQIAINALEQAIRLHKETARLHAEMAKTLTISVPDQDYEFFRYALDQLADEVISDDEAGQRNAKRSVFILMIATAGITNFGETVRLLREIKRLT